MIKFHKTILGSVLTILLITFIGISVFFFAGKELLNIVKADFVYAVVQGQPKEMVRENLNKSHKKDAIQIKMGTLLCDKIKLNVPVYLGDTKENLIYGAGVYAGGSVPGESGTTLISAHNITYFRPLEKIKEEDIITFSTEDMIYTYKVQNIHIFKDSKEYTIKKDGAEQLVLYTCYPFNVSGEMTEQRFFVTCSLVSIETKRIALKHEEKKGGTNEQ